MTQVVALSIVAVTVGLSLGRPRIGRVRIHHGTAAVLGAGLTVLLGVGPPDLLVTAARLLAAPVVTIVSLMVMTQIAERAGLFALLGDALARRARGSGRRLFTYLFFVGVMVGTVFTNDAAVLIFTPIVFGLVEQIGGRAWRPENKLPFYFAVLYIANLVGALVIANPINLVVANLLGIGFVEFAVWMALPAAVSIAVSFVGLRWYFRKSLPQEFTIAMPEQGRRGLGPVPASCALVVALTLVGFFAEPVTGVPTWLVALAGAAALVLLHKMPGGGELRPVFRGVGWDVIVFMCGMFVIGLALRHVGITHMLGGLIEHLSGEDLASRRGWVGLLAGACSAVINNHPTADLMAFTIQDFALPLPEKKLLAFAALIGGDLGPKMLPIGSLAALIWFRLLRNRGVEVPYALYIRIGVPVTLAALVASLLALELQVRMGAALGLLTGAGS
jgi:arsenical pump membrane protein